jgi:beta-glucosidase
MEEVYGESPFLVAELGIAMTTGLQENYQVASTAKHFAIYSAPKGGREWMVRTDPKTGPRETHDLFLYPFRRVIQEAGLLGIMISYNDYDGVPVSGSSYYLIDLLRNDYGFSGYVVSDSDALAYL